MATAIGAGWAGTVARPSQRALVRRRTTVAGAVAATVVGCIAMAGGFGTASPSHSSVSTASAASLGMSPVGAKVYIVQPGDTLWGIASSLVGDGDPRPLMQALSSQLHGGVLRVGQRLILP